MSADRLDIERAKADRELLVQALQEAGGSISGSTVQCPFHDDRHPSGGIHDHEGVFLYTCQGACGFTGDVFAVVMRARGCNFSTALQLLGIRSGNGRATALGTGTRTIAEPSRPSADELVRARQDADEAHQRLLDSPEDLNHLLTSRGIDRATVERFKVGIIGEKGTRRWTFPLVGADAEFVGMKLHAADGQNPKGLFHPTGVTSSHLFPVALDGEGSVWLCPGELKALAVAALGLPAIGITSGEGTEKTAKRLPEHVIALLSGRRVALAIDDDPTGRLWGETVRKQLADAGIEAREVMLYPRGNTHRDVGDFIVELRNTDTPPEDIRSELLHRYELSDPWRAFTFAGIVENPKAWEPATYIPTGLRDLDAALGGLRTGAVLLFAGKPGMAKTQTAVQVALNAAKRGIPVGIISLEMDRFDVVKLLTAQLARVPRKHVELGKLTADEVRRFQEALAEHKCLPLTIVDDEFWPGGLDRDRLRDLIAEGVRRFGWRIVVIDYLGLLAPGADDRSDFQTDLLNSSMLRRTARAHDVALLVVCGLRKTSASTSGERAVNLDDVAGAGRLTYDAQAVLHIESDRQNGVIHLSVLKARYSDIDAREQLRLRWHPSFGVVEDTEHGGSATTDRGGAP